MAGDLPDGDELVRLYRLIHELCEIGADTNAWRVRLLTEMEELLQVRQSVSYLMHFSLDPSRMDPKTYVYIERGMNAAWHRYREVGDLSRDPATPHIMQRFGTDFTATRAELVDDATWYASPYYTEIAQPSEMHDLLYSQVAVKDPSVVDGLGFVRSPGEPRFTAKDVNVVRFVHQELARLWNRPDPIGIHTLPPRQREVLDGIRRGESRKAIAEKMMVGESTVHSYEKALFQRAGVKSRGELIASLSGTIRPNLLP